MAKIVDNTFFYDDLSIAQITEDSVLANLQRFINKKEPEFLQLLLGYELYKGLIVEDPTERFTDLINGKEYTDQRNHLAKWEGLKRTVVAASEGVTAVYQSPIANYIYFHYMADAATQTTGTGEKISKSENSLNVSPRRKMARAWNEMVDWNWELVEFLNTHRLIYPEFVYPSNAYRPNFYGNHPYELLTKINPLF